MRVRALDEDGDWTFGKGRQSYLRNRAALAQVLKTRLLSFLGDAFFALADGLDWFTLLGGKDRLEIELSLSARILNTEGVTGIRLISFVPNPRTRGLSIQYEVQSIYGPIGGEFSLDQNPIG